MQTTKYTAEEVMGLLSAFSGAQNAIVIPRPYILLLQEYDRKQRLQAGRTTEEIAADWEAAYILGQLVFWSFKRSNTVHRGWFYKTDEELKREAGITQAQINRVKKKLRGVGLETMRRKIDTEALAPKTHYRINWDVFYPLLKAVVVVEETVQVGEVRGEKPKPERKETKPKPDKSSDPVEVWRGFVGRYPGKEWHADIHATCQDTALLKDTLRYVTERGWNPHNIANVLRAYKAGEARSAEPETALPPQSAVIPSGNAEWSRRLSKRAVG